MFFLLYFIIAFGTERLDESIRLHQAFNACDNALTFYPQEIAQQFPNGVVRSEHEQFQNLFCECESIYWMVCKIVVPAHSVHERLILSKLDVADPQNMRPFFVFPQMSGTDIVFIAEDCDPRVVAEITVERGMRQRSRSAPPAIRHFPSKRISLVYCTCNDEETVCPILQIPFKPGDVLCILKNDADKVAEGRYVPCISLAGLQKLAKSRNSVDGGFVDPLRREDEKILTIEGDYDKYVVSEDKHCADSNQQSARGIQIEKVQVTFFGSVADLNRFRSGLFILFLFLMLICKSTISNPDVHTELQIDFSKEQV